MAGKYKLPIRSEIIATILKSLSGVFCVHKGLPQAAVSVILSPFFNNEMAGGRKYRIVARAPIGKISWRVRRNSASVGEPGE